MKTLTATALLSVMFLSAGAFAGDSHNVTAPILAKSVNVTVVQKNQAWPVAGQISVEPCSASRCIDI
jgi:hypothetical protein